MVTEIHIGTAIHWWCAENSVDSSVRPLLLFLFDTLDSLHAAVLDFPETWSTDAHMGIQSAGTHSIYIGLRLRPSALFLLRSAIALSGDAFCIAKRLSQTNLFSLQGPLSDLLQELDGLRDLRNFFAHLDDRLANLDAHGITGTVNTGCGIEYNGATGCFHLVLVGNTIHYVSNGSGLQTDIGKDSFLRLLVLARPIYAELISHKTHQGTCNYLPPDDMYAT